MSNKRSISVGGLRREVVRIVVVVEVVYKVVKWQALQKIGGQKAVMSKSGVGVTYRIVLIIHKTTFHIRGSQN